MFKDHDQTSFGQRQPFGQRKHFENPGRPADVSIHPRRVQGLTNRLARLQADLPAMQRTAISAVERTIQGLGSLERASRPGGAERLAAALEDALRELTSLDLDALPEAERLFMIARRLEPLAEIVSALAAAEAGLASRSPPGAEADRWAGGPAAAGRRRRACSFS